MNSEKPIDPDFIRQYRSLWPSELARSLKCRLCESPATRRKPTQVDRTTYEDAAVCDKH